MLISSVDTMDILYSVSISREYKIFDQYGGIKIALYQ